MIQIGVSEFKLAPVGWSPFTITVTRVLTSRPWISSPAFRYLEVQLDGKDLKPLGEAPVLAQQLRIVILDGRASPGPSQRPRLMNFIPEATQRLKRPNNLVSRSEGDILTCLHVTARRVSEPERVTLRQVECTNCATLSAGNHTRNFCFSRREPAILLFAFISTVL